MFRNGDEVDLRSRNDRPLARYFPELVDALRSLSAERVVLDLADTLREAPAGVSLTPTADPAAAAAWLEGRGWR